MNEELELKESINNSEKLLTFLLNKKAALNLDSQRHNDISNDNVRKIHILALLKQLKMNPLKSNTSKTIPLSISNHLIREEISLLNDMVSTKDTTNSKIIDIMNTLSSMDTLNDNNDRSTDAFLEKIDNLKADSRRLSSFIKIIVNDYLFTKEFEPHLKHLDEESFKLRRNNFLKLLETLLNNNILYPNNENHKWLKIDKMEDPLIRFLLSNKLIIVHPTINNKIMLNDLSVDL